MSRILGAILAGGQSRRFGSDKALAEYRGSRLIEHVAARLGPQVDAIVVCGRDIDGWTCVPDRPGPGLGPLAGVNAALHCGWANGFDSVVTVPCDTPGLPADLVAILRAHGPTSYLANLPVIGLWPSSLAGDIDRHLQASTDRSMRAAAAAVGAAPVTLPLANVNTPADLQAIVGGK